MAERDQQAIAAYNEGVAHMRAGRLADARACYERALALEPAYVQALTNLGTVLDDAGEHGAAEARYRAAIAADGRRPEPWTGLGTTLRAQGRIGEARTAYERALVLAPDFAAARWNLALVDLADGRFADGWTGYLFRPSVDRASAPLASPPLAADLSGQVIEIVDEQGLGDALFFLRFVRELHRRGAAVHYTPDRRLAGIVSRMLDLTGGTPTLRIALGDLPYLLGAEACPPPVRVKPLPERVAAMRETLRAAGPPPYVGLTWRAGQEAAGYLSKHIGVELLGAAVRDVPGTLIDLQRAPAVGEHAALERAAGRAVADLSACNADLEDILALMALIDEYVGVSNTNMHLRAAVGAGARVLVAHPPEYRWMSHGEASPWFPGFRLYRGAPEGDWTDALAALRADLHGDRAVLAHRAGDAKAAERHFAIALAARPDAPSVHFNVGNFLRDAGRPQEAETHYRRALAGDPNMAAAHNNLGNLMKAAKRWDDAAAAYRAAIAADPAFAPAHRNLADLDEATGRSAAALAGWSRAIAVRPDDAGLRIRDALVMPVIASSVQEIDDHRARMTDRLAALTGAGLRLDDPLGQVGATPFYLAYHGRDDRPLMESLAARYREACPSLSYQAPHVAQWLGPLEGGRIRVGFVSTFLGDHTIGRLNANLIAQLPRDRFEVIVFDRLPRNLDAARREIAAAEFDILYYPDVGMEPLTYFLAFARLAPIQCVTWGHPVTTGISTIDYFVSSRLIEPDGAATHYAERLICLDSLPSSAAAETAEAPGSGPTFLCAQSLFKLHPEFDPLIGRILRQCPGAELALVEGPYADWRRLLEARWRRAMPDVLDRIRFVARRDRPEFMGLLASARVILDTPHFCGGLSSFEALIAGAPVVTLPGAFMRGRVTLGLYRRMGMEDLVARNGDAYVELAVWLARDGAFNAKTRQRIRETAPRLVGDPAPIAEHAAFFERAIYETT